MKELEFPRRTIQQILSDLKARDLINDWEEADENCFVATTVNGWRSAAKFASMTNNGNFHDSQNGFRWHCGSINKYVMRPKTYKEIKSMRRLVEKHTGITPKWSYGNCARACLAFSFPQHKKKAADSLIDIDGFIGYHEAAPGRYDYGISFDAKSCYFQMLKRLKSPRVTVDESGDLEYVMLDRESQARWSDTLQFVAEHKVLRNSMWGSMLGCVSERFHFHHGEETKSQTFEGHSYAAGALIGRSAWEVCRTVANDTNAVYAQTDGVIVTSGIMPNYFNRVGLQYEVKSAGETHIIGQHRWKCGKKFTAYYNENSRFTDPAPRAELPAEMWHTRWLW